MKDFGIKLLWQWLGSHKISLAVIVAVWLMLSPSYNSFIQLVTKVEAHEKKFEKIDMINDKLTEVMIEIGIQKHKIDAIERRHNNNTNPRGK